MKTHFPNILHKNRFSPKLHQHIFYDSHHHKIIPKYIFSSSMSIKKSFLNGLFDTDLFKSIDNLKLQYKIKIKSQIGMSHLFYFLSNMNWNPIIYYDHTLHYSKYKYNIIISRFKWLSKQNESITDIHFINDYNGYVYDCTTENNHFSAGIGQLIVHNTDSIYCHFPDKKKLLWKFATQVEKEFTALFPSPMKLVFEEKIYRRFLILTKKRYMAFTQNEDLSIDSKLTIRGVLLARRDNCKWIRYLYELIVRKLMDLQHHHNFDEISFLLIDEFNKLMSHYWNSSYFIITKALGKDYKIKSCPGFDLQKKQIIDEKKWQKRLTELHISPSHPNWYELYKQKVLPAHAQLAHKMKNRGCPVDVGSRIEFLIIQHENIKAKSFDKIEDPVYQKIYADILKLDFLYILHLAINPFDQLLNIVFKIPNFVEQQYKLRLLKHNILIELLSIFSPSLKFK
jgi:hypothetical protein